MFEIGAASGGGDKLLARQSMAFDADGFKFNKYGKALGLGDRSCKFINGEGSNSAPWWVGRMSEMQNITSVSFYNYQNGDTSSSLSGSYIYVGNTICAIIPDNLPLNQQVTIDCLDMPFQPEFANRIGIFGNKITIASQK